MKVVAAALKLGKPSGFDSRYPHLIVALAVAYRQNARPKRATRHKRWPRNLPWAAPDAQHAGITLRCWSRAGDNPDNRPSWPRIIALGCQNP